MESDKNLDPDFLDTEMRMLLQPNEKILGYFTPSKIVLVMAPFSAINYIALMFFVIPFDTCDYQFANDQCVSSFITFSKYIFLFIFAFSIVNMFFKWFLLSRKKCLVTNQRIIFREGILFIDFISVYFDKIQNMSVDVTFLDKILGIGTIIVKTVASEFHEKNIRSALRMVKNPYEVYNLIQVATDDYKKNKL